jgi:hypothetical protein
MMKKGEKEEILEALSELRRGFEKGFAQIHKSFDRIEKKRPKEPKLA